LEEKRLVTPKQLNFLDDLAARKKEPPLAEIERICKRFELVSESDLLNLSSEKASDLIREMLKLPDRKE